MLLDHEIKLYPIGPVDPSLNFQKPLDQIVDTVNEFNKHAESIRSSIPQQPVSTYKSIQDFHRASLD